VTECWALRHACSCWSHSFHPHVFPMLRAWQIKRFVDVAHFNVYRRTVVARSVGGSLRSLVYCPRQDCYSVCHVPPELARSRPGEVCCQTCGHSFCLLCHAPWHPSHRCHRVSKTLPSPLPQPSKKHPSPAALPIVKPCPGCRIHTMHVPGTSAHMSCSVCAAEYCFTCGRNVEVSVELVCVPCVLLHCTVTRLAHTRCCCCCCCCYCCCYRCCGCCRCCVSSFSFWIVVQHDRFRNHWVNGRCQHQASSSPQTSSRQVLSNRCHGICLRRGRLRRRWLHSGV